MRSKKGLHDIGRPPQKETVSDLRHAPIRAMEVLKNGQIRPLTYYNGKGLGDVRWVSGRFLLSLQEIWEELGDDILRRVAASHPELLMMAMVKISAVQRIGVGQPGASGCTRPHPRPGLQRVSFARPLPLSPMPILPYR